MFDRATREWPTSPIRPTVRPSIVPFFSADGHQVEQALGGVLVGAVAGVDDRGLDVLGEQVGAPGVGWRTTRTSAPIASMFLAVSMKVSPLVRLETLAEKSWTSAESRLAARLKLVRVLVEFSKNRLKTTRPCRAGTFFRLRRETSENDSAVSRMAEDLLAREVFQAEQVLAVPGRRRGHRGRLRWGRGPPDGDPDDLVDRVDRPDPDPDGLGPLGLDDQAHGVGPDGQLAMPAVDQHGQADPRRPAEVADRVQGGPDRPAGVEHVVDQDDLGAVDGEGDLGAEQDRPAVAVAQVVAIERDVQRPDRHGAAEELAQLLGDPRGDRHAPGPDPDQGQRRPLGMAGGEPGRQRVERRLQAGGVEDEHFGRTHLRIPFDRSPVPPPGGSYRVEGGAG